jgi:hypothetical protein
MCRLQIKSYNVGITFLRNVGNALPDYTVSHHRKTQCCRGRGKSVQITGAGSVPDYARIFFLLFHVSCRANGTCGLRPSCVRTSLLCILKFFYWGPNPFSAALDTRSIDTAALSYSPFESSWPCFEKPGN